MKHLRSIPVFPAAALCAVALSLAGCGQSIEKNQLFKDQQKIVARLDDDSKRIGLQVEDMQVSVNTIKQDVRELKNSPRASLTGNKDLETRLKSLETSIAELQSAINSQVTRMAKLDSPSKKSRSQETEVASADEETGDDSAPAEKAAPARSKSASKPARAPESKPVKPRGAYYKVQDGDTPEGIASAHRITVQALYSENRIPSGGKIFPGQQIYVPASN